MKALIERLAKNETWEHILLAVERFGESRLPKSFAKYISLSSMIVSDMASESMKLKLMALLGRHGASVVKERRCGEAMETAFRREEFDIVYCLIESGVNPSAISLENGDTLLHASLDIALQTGVV